MKREYYEISVWENQLIPEQIIEGVVVPSHYEEKKIAIIGSSEMDSAGRAYNPKLVRNINGTNIFTFSIQYMLPNEEVDLTEYLVGPQNRRVEEKKKGLVKNPLTDLLFAESKVKLFWQGKWYDLVVKEVVKDNKDKRNDYKCIDSYVNELSRTGYNITFDTELRNNIGTATELVEETLKGSEWTFDREGSDLLQEIVEESVYEVELIREVTAENDSKGGVEVISVGEKVLLYYSQVQELLGKGESGTDLIQFAYAEEFEQDFLSPLVLNSNCYSLTVTWSKTQNSLILQQDGQTIVELSLNSLPSIYYRAERLVRNQKSKLEPMLGRYVSVFKAVNNGNGYSTGDVIHGYEETVFTDPHMVENLIINSSNFSSSEGWSGANLVYLMYPQFTSGMGNLDSFSSKSYLRLEWGNYYYNKAITSSSHLLDKGLQVGQEYVVRIKAKDDDGNTPSNFYAFGGIVPSIQQYMDNGLYIQPSGGLSYATVTSLPMIDNWISYKVTITRSVPRSDLRKERVGLFFQVSSNLWVEEVEMYPLEYGEDENGNIVQLEPGKFDSLALNKTQYSYYNFTEQELVDEPSRLKYLWRKTQDWENTDIQSVYLEDFEKARTISESGSTRFNILQTIAETFEGWMKFEIEHEENGELVYDPTGAPKKTVRLVRDVGKDTGVDFIYGLDLQSISRTHQSNEISTKTIVPPNVNSFAKDGVASIDRAVENWPRVNYILNFDYYVAQGLIDAEELGRDLHDPVNGIGLEERLRRSSTNYDKENVVLSHRKMELLKTNTVLNTYDATIESIQTELQNLRNALVAIAGATSWSSAQSYISANATEDGIAGRVASVLKLENDLEHYLKAREDAETAQGLLEEIIGEKEVEVKEYLDEIKEVEEEFNRKYSRFIQEGVWQDSKYLSNSLYFLDAQKVALRSAKPEVSYNISVARLSMLEEFEGKEFEVGDIARVQDEEFLGTTVIEGIKTPIREKILISEASYSLDDPSKDTLSVQNYRSQFEDLFQRIVSNVQNLQFASGGYNAVAGAFGVGGGGGSGGNLFIDPRVLSNSFIASRAVIDEAFIDTAHIRDASIDNAKIGYAAIRSANIDDAAITRAKIQQAAINTALIDKGAVGTAQIADGSITDAKIVNLTANKIDAGELAVERLIIRDPVNPENSLIYAINNIDGALQSVRGDYLNGEIVTPRSITTDRIVVGAITGEEIAAETILANNISANAIEAAHLSANSVEASAIRAGAVTAEKISVTDLNALNATIAGWTIGEKAISSVSGSNSIYLYSAGSTSSYWMEAVGSSGSFIVDKQGKLTATGASIRGSLNADDITTGTLTGVTISGNTITGGNISGTTISGSTIISSGSGSGYDYYGGYYFSGDIILTGSRLDLDVEKYYYGESGSCTGGVSILDSGIMITQEVPGINETRSVNFHDTGIIHSIDGYSQAKFYIDTTYGVKISPALDCNSIQTNYLNIDGDLRIWGDIHGRNSTSLDITSYGNIDVRPASGKRMYVYGDLRPGGSQNLGGDSYRWDTVYLYNQPDVSSDTRHKEFIQSIPKELLERLSELEPKMYKQNDKWHFGYIAQDIERVLYKYAVSEVGFENAKELVEEFAVLSKDESYMSLLYGEIAVLREAQFINKIEELEKRIIQLEGGTSD